jgi:hypothetical protein
MTVRRNLVAFTLVLGSTLAGELFQPGARAVAETPMEMLAAQVRTQGIACDNPKRAVRDAKRSRPDHEVWILTCENATYRVSRYPDLAARVKRIR